MSFNAPADFRDPSKWDYIATTPKAITPAIGGLCVRILEKWFADVQLPPVPVFVPVQPIVPPEQGISRCYVIVSGVNIPGSRIVHGFTIWEQPGIYLTTEHHAILQMPGGTLVDVTPTMAREKKILFLPVRYQDEWHLTADNDKNPPKPLFIPLSDHPLVLEVVKLKDQLDTLLIQSRAHTQLYRNLDDQVCRNIALFHKIMKERVEKNKMRERKKKERKRR